MGDSSLNAVLPSIHEYPVTAIGRDKKAREQQSSLWAESEVFQGIFGPEVVVFGDCGQRGARFLDQPKHRQGRIGQGWSDHAQARAGQMMAVLVPPITNGPSQSGGRRRFARLKPSGSRSTFQCLFARRLTCSMYEILAGI